MKQIASFALILGLINGAFISTIEAQNIGGSISTSIGYWKPSLEEVNNALSLWAEKLKEEEITPQGDGKFSGNFTAGGILIIKIFEQLNLRGDLFYWKKTIEQKAHEVRTYSEYDYWSGTYYNYTTALKGEAHASIQIIPVVLSGQYYFGDLKNRIRPYIGGGLGLAFSIVDVEAFGKVTASNHYNNETYAESDDFKSDHFSFGAILQIVGGVELVSTKHLSFFLEEKYLSGNFNVEEKNNNINEDVSISGLQISFGIRFNFGN